MAFAFPLLLDITDRLIVIVGGGAVGLRKAKGVIEAGGTRLAVISPMFADGFPPAAQRLQTTYEARHLDGASLVFAATDSPTVNAKVVQDARSRGIWVNRADIDETDPGDFSTPAALRQGKVTITVSTDNPALSAVIRDTIQKQWDTRWTQMADTMQSLRPWLRDSGLPIETRRAIFRSLATDDAMNVLAQSGRNALRVWLQQKHPQLPNWPKVDHE